MDFEHLPFSPKHIRMLTAVLSLLCNNCGRNLEHKASMHWIKLFQTLRILCRLYKISPCPLLLEINSHRLLSFISITFWAFICSCCREITYKFNVHENPSIWPLKFSLKIIPFIFVLWVIILYLSKMGKSHLFCNNCPKSYIFSTMFDFG